MKHMRKVFALALTLIMALALTVPAFAADITITDAQPGETYSAYKIFNYTSSGTNFAYTMPSSSEWKGAVDRYTNAAGQDVFTLTPSATDDTTLIVTINSGVEFKTDTQAAHFADYLSTCIPASFAADSAVTPISGTADSTGKVSFTGIDAGYYFVDTSLGSLCSLFNFGASQTLAEKNAEPTLEKKIVVGNNEVDETTATISNTINYKITVTDGKGTDSAITVHDVMDSGLTLNTTTDLKSAFTVTTVDGSDEGTDVADITSDDWSVAVGTGTGEGVTACAFEITFNAEFVKKLAEGDKIVITYSAELNKDAVIANSTNDNKAWLTYSAQKSIEDTVTVKTFEFDLLKYTKEVTTDPESKKTTTTETKLDGATFKLYDAETNGDEIQLVSMGNNVYRVADDTQQSDDGGAIISAGRVTIQGLGNGTYWLEELTAPDGYNLLAKRVEVVISGANRELDDKASTTTDGDGNSTVSFGGTGIKVLNLTGAELPSTGGIGTTIFYMVGGILMAGAAILLITKKKMSNEQ